MASDFIDFGHSREQGGIDAGPMPARYRGLYPYLLMSLFLIVLIAWVLIARRVRRRRRRGGLYLLGRSRDA